MGVETNINYIPHYDNNDNQLISQAVLIKLLLKDCSSNFSLQKITCSYETRVESYPTSNSTTVTINTLTY